MANPTVSSASGQETETEKFLRNLYACVAYPCTAERAEGSAFCADCKEREKK